jgi:hypothetical protein
VVRILCHGGREGIRTPDPLLAKQVLSQLSYTPTKQLILILKHFTFFCPSLFMFLGLNRAFTVHLLVDRAHWTVWLANCYGRGDFTGNRAAQVNWLSLSERIRW